MTRITILNMDFTINKVFLKKKKHYGQNELFIVTSILKGYPQVKFLNSTVFELETCNFTVALLIAS